MPLPAFISAMLDPGFYPHRPAAVTLVQTHISYVLLAGSEVYKVRKPVRFSFLDFSTLDRRRYDCGEEVRLNRRLAPDVYRGVVSVCAENGRFRLGAEDDPSRVEYAVHMRRLPEDRRLDQLLVRGAVAPAMIDQIAERLATFHREASAGDEVIANGRPAAVAAILDGNFAAVLPFRDATVPAADDDAIQNFAHDFLARHDSLFRKRQAQKRIREGHGDLHTDHVYFANGLVIVDCIEFNTAYRYCDVASDIAFLSMDLDYLGHAELAAQLVERYAALADDPDLPRLVPFYASYRAYVRGKVDSLKSVEDEVGPDEQNAARDSARRHFDLAYRYTWVATPALVVVAGLSGTGKSTVAAELQRRTGFVHINSDVVRKRLAGLAPTDRGQAAYRAGLYSPEHSVRTYDAMYEMADAALAAGRGAIVDATFQLAVGRQAARRIAAGRVVPFLLVECRCPEGDIESRLRKRTERGDSASDADWEIHLEQRRRCEPFTEPDRLVLDTTASPAELSRRIERTLRERHAPTDSQT